MRCLSEIIPDVDRPGVLNGFRYFTRGNGRIAAYCITRADHGWNVVVPRWGHLLCRVHLGGIFPNVD